MPQYYGVARSSEYLAHYGVKGMKWGVRRALERGSDRALRRQRIKAERKLNKLMKLGTNKDKYKKRAIAYGLGAAKLGSLAAAGTTGIGSGIARLGVAKYRSNQKLGAALQKLSGNGILNGTGEGAKLASLGSRLQGEEATKRARDIFNAGKAVRDYGKGNSIGKRLSGSDVIKVKNSAGQVVMTKPNTAATNSALRKITNEQYLRGVAAARNAYRAKTADRNIIKAAKWKAEMDRTFAGTKYANGVPAKKRRRARG